MLNELGFLSLTIIVLTLYRFTRKSLSGLEKSNPISAISTCLLSLLSLIIYSFFSGVIVTPMTQTLFLILIGLTLGLKSSRENRQPVIISQKESVYLSIVIVTYLLLAYFSYNCTSSKPSGPDFWSNGNISIKYCKNIL